VLARIAARSPAELGQAVGAEPGGAAIGLGQVVAAAHVALVEGAVGHGEHVAGLVRGQGHGAAQAQMEGGIALGRIAEAVDGPHAHPVRERGLPEHEVPSLPRPQVGRGEGDVGHGVVGQARREDLLQHVRAQDLADLPGRMLAPGTGRHERQRQILPDLHRQTKEVLHVLRRQADHLALRGGELAQRLHVDRAPAAVRAHRVAPHVLSVALARLRMLRQPLARSRRVQPLVQREQLLKRCGQRRPHRLPRLR